GYLHASHCLFIACQGILKLFQGMSLFSQLICKPLHDTRRRCLSFVHQHSNTILAIFGELKVLQETLEQRCFSHAALTRNRDNIVTGIFWLENHVSKKAQLIITSNKKLCILWLRFFERHRDSPGHKKSP